MSNQRPPDRHGTEVTWRGGARYSPVQDRTGIKDPARLEFPPAAERVTQDPDAYRPAFLDEREIMRATYQGDDRCQLACPGCYTGGRLSIPVADVVRAGRRKVAPHEAFVAHLEALGDGLQDLYLIGAEPTMDPPGSAAKLGHARERGWPQQTITHGAVPTDRFEATFGAALDSGMVYMLVISLDSMDPEVNNALRGRSYAHARTVATIEHCVERGAPFKVQMTVWPRNYPTILDSVARLYELGVRAFSFHCGSLEGVTDEAADRSHLAHLDPLAWRALAEQLLAFRDAHRDQLWHFNVPFLYFTETELREQVIGDEARVEAYLAHVDAVEAGEASAKPVHACPALDVPQVYVYANDGPTSAGTVSLCNIHNPAGADAYADFDPERGRFVVRTDPAANQMQQMIDSPHLCPALPHATRAASDRVDTEAGPLYHACRYIASNQMPAEPGQFGHAVYADALDFYAAFARALDVYPAPSPEGEWPLGRIRRLIDPAMPLRERAAVLREDLAAFTPARAVAS